MAVRLAWGSCNKQQRPQPLWPRILDRRPAVFIWAGDNVYHDRRNGVNFTSVPVEEMRANYAQQLAVPGYAKLLETLPVVGTWDDHDYGLNDAGMEFPNRSESQELFFDFLGEPADSPLRQQEGVYSSHVLPTPTGEQIKIILLDVRFHRTAYRADGIGQILGEAQWQWLEHELTNSSAAAHLIVSGFQVLPEHRYIGEGWYRMPAERARLFDLIFESKAKGPILLSGDVHFAEMNQALCTNGAGESRALIEITSSGMTHGWGVRRAYRNSAVPAAPSLEGLAEGWIGLALVHLTQHLIPFEYLQRSPDGRRQYYAGLNFGELELLPSGDGHVVSRVLDEGGTIVLEATHQLTGLGGGPASRAGRWTCRGHSSHFSALRYDIGFYSTVIVVISTLSFIPLTVFVTVICCCRAILRQHRATLKSKPSRAKLAKRK